MKSRVHSTYKKKYHVRNWAFYDRALVRRGDASVWLSPEAIAAWEPAGGCTRGGQLKYPDLAIETTLTLSLIFNLPLRQTEGFLKSLFGMMGINRSAPDHTTLSRRGQHRSGPRNLDSGLSEISIVFQAAVPKLVASKYTTSGVRRPSEL